jgi:hypothetical protein
MSFREEIEEVGRLCPLESAQVVGLQGTALTLPTTCWLALCAETDYLVRFFGWLRNGTGLCTSYNISMNFQHQGAKTEAPAGGLT